MKYLFTTTDGSIVTVEAESRTGAYKKARSETYFTKNELRYHGWLEAVLGESSEKDVTVKRP